MTDQVMPARGGRYGAGPPLFDTDEAYARFVAHPERLIHGFTSSRPEYCAALWQAATDLSALGHAGVAAAFEQSRAGIEEGAVTYAERALKEMKDGDPDAVGLALVLNGLHRERAYQKAALLPEKVALDAAKRYIARRRPDHWPVLSSEVQLLLKWPKQLPPEIHKVHAKRLVKAAKGYKRMVSVSRHTRTVVGNVEDMLARRVFDRPKK